jgi:hypothetical protein
MNPRMELALLLLNLIIARFIYSDYKRTSSVTAMMNELGWKPLNERRKEQRLVLLFKIAISKPTVS